MNAQEFELTLRLIAGHWPTPEMGEDEIIVWRRTLLPLPCEDACTVIDMMSRNGPKWRPTDGEFVAEYRQRTARPKSFPEVTSLRTPQLDGPRNACGHSLNAVACVETVNSYLAQCRETLASSQGPLARSFRLPSQPTEEIF